MLIDGLDTIDGVTFHDLYQAYPEFDIDVPREQQLLIGHDVVVVQHPFFWYSTPALMKEWQDLVLEHGWAYGSQGHHLTGKLCLNVVTTGGPAGIYREQDNSSYTVRRFLAPIEQTALLCNMIYLAPYVVHGTHAISKADIKAHQATYWKVLTSLRDESLDLEQARQRSYLNDFFN